MRHEHRLLFTCSHNRTSHSCTLRRSTAGILPRQRGIRGVSLGADGVYLAHRTKRIFHLRKIAKSEKRLCGSVELLRKDAQPKYQFSLVSTNCLKRHKIEKKENSVQS